MDIEKKALSRRKILTRIGLVAAAAYTVPAVTSLSMAHASSGASSASGNSDPSEASEASEVSEASEASEASLASVASTPSSVEDACGPADVGNPTYDACVIANGF